MASIDIVLIIILAWGAYHGYKKGLLMEIFALFALIIGIIGGFKLLHAGMDFLDQHVSINGNLLPYVAFILIFILIVIGVNLLGRAIKKILDMTLLGSVDNLFGALIGALKWAFGLSVLIWLSDNFGLSFPESSTENTIVFPFVESFAPIVVNTISNWFPYTEGMVDGIREMLGN
ncbi:MAG: CvpA family protein [Cyclobacteriaceae bacterium]|nr:CvpA family protein [Cyclobacteriaceae bacterium]